MFQGPLSRSFKTKHSHCANLSKKSEAFAWIHLSVCLHTLHTYKKTVGALRNEWSNDIENLTTSTYINRLTIEIAPSCWAAQICQGLAAASSAGMPAFAQHSRKQQKPKKTQKQHKHQSVTLRHTPSHLHNSNRSNRSNTLLTLYLNALHYRASTLCNGVEGKIIATYWSHSLV